MFNTNAVPSLSDIAAVTNNNDGFGGNNGWWILIILFALFGGWGRGGYGYGITGDGTGSVTPGYVLSQDFAILERKADAINNGICSLGYDQLSQMNGINTNIYAAQTAITAQLNNMAAQNAACCCETKNLISTLDAQTNYNMATQFCNTRQLVADAKSEIVANDNANYRALNDRLTQMEMNAKDAQIADLKTQLFNASLAASQAAQNEYIVNRLQPTAVPAYTVPNPYATYGCGCYSNNGCCGA